MHLQFKRSHTLNLYPVFAQHVMEKLTDILVHTFKTFLVFCIKFYLSTGVAKIPARCT